MMGIADRDRRRVLRAARGKTMKTRGNPSRSISLSRWIAGLLALLTVPAASFAEGDDSGWTPAFRIGPGVHLQGLDGSVRSPDSLPFIQMPSGVPDNPATNANEGFDVSTQGAPGDSAQTIAFRFGLRLYTPEDLLPISEKVRPRLFFLLGAELPLDDGFVAMRYDQNFDNNVAQLYGAGRTLSEFCPGTPATQACRYSSRVNIDILANWSAGFGADFTLPVWENQFHLVPFLEYFGQAFESQGEFGLTLSQNLQSDVNRNIKSESDTELLHGLAAGLGFEVDVYETKRFGIRLFLESRAAWILNDREVRYSGTNQTPTPNFNTADFMIRPSGFVVTTAGGIEIRLNGL
jgi:hypothetical protein